MRGYARTKAFGRVGAGEVATGQDERSDVGCEQSLKLCPSAANALVLGQNDPAAATNVTEPPTHSPAARNASGTSVEPRHSSRNRTRSGSGRAKPLPHQVLDHVALDAVVLGQALEFVTGGKTGQHDLLGHARRDQHPLTERNPRGHPDAAP